MFIYIEKTAAKQYSGYDETSCLGQLKKNGKTYFAYPAEAILDKKLLENFSEGEDYFYSKKLFF